MGKRALSMIRKGHQGFRVFRASRVLGFRVLELRGLRL